MASNTVATLTIKNRAPYNITCTLTFKWAESSQVRKTEKPFMEGQNQSIVVPIDATDLQLNVHAVGGSSDPAPMYPPDPATWSNHAYAVRTGGTVTKPSVKPDN